MKKQSASKKSTFPLGSIALKYFLHKRLNKGLIRACTYCHENQLQMFCICLAVSNHQPHLSIAINVKTFSAYASLAKHSIATVIYFTGDDGQKICMLCLSKSISFCFQCCHSGGCGPERSNISCITDRSRKLIGQQLSSVFLLWQLLQVC